MLINVIKYNINGQNNSIRIVNRQLIFYRLFEHNVICIRRQNFFICNRQQIESFQGVMAETNLIY